jgi:hypothetical protein
MCTIDIYTHVQYVIKLLPHDVNTHNYHTYIYRGDVKQLRWMDGIVQLNAPAASKDRCQAYDCYC